ncbi:hypothetical protein ACH347_22790 [Saccharopolyspora sp. 5N102]|uniref:hypothetical protein n=1 Tax=Saccharopolyspora sp. 5N102 TaxID=3375155 RepID=UPI0037916875
MAALIAGYLCLVGAGAADGLIYEAVAGDSERRLEEAFQSCCDSVHTEEDIYTDEDVENWARNSDLRGPSGNLVEPAQEHLADVEQYKVYNQAIMWTGMSLCMAGVLIGFIYLLRARRMRKHFEQGLRDDAERRAADPSFAQRLQELTAILETSQRLIGEMSAEVRARKEMLEQLSESAEENRELAEIHAEKAAAIDARIAKHINSANAAIMKQQKYEFWKNIVIGSILVAIIVGLFTNAISDVIKSLMGLGS